MLEFVQGKNMSLEEYETFKVRLEIGLQNWGRSYSEQWESLGGIQR